MANPKRKKIQAALDKIPKENFGEVNLLTSDLAEKVGSLEGRAKITIRLDVRVIDEAKKESEELGVGYQKIINDRLLEIYDLSESSYLSKSDLSVNKLLKEMKNMEQRIKNLEKKQA